VAIFIIFMLLVLWLLFFIVIKSGVRDFEKVTGEGRSAPRAVGARH
jgi:hypothetical protein